MIEREHILQDIEEVLGTVEGVVLATRDLSTAARVSDFPTLFLVDLGGEVEGVRGGQKPCYQDRLNIRVVAIIRGTTTQKTPEEMSAFWGKVERQLYARGRVVGTLYKGQLIRTKIHPLLFPRDGGNRIATQAIDYDVIYVEDVSREFV